VVMIGVVAVPISIGGWGLRELAVVSLLGTHGVAPEKALLFSVCFGLALAVAFLPGALVWLLYPFAPPPPSAERDGWRVAISHERHRSAGVAEQTANRLQSSIMVVGASSASTSTALHADGGAFHSITLFDQLVGADDER